MAPDILPQRSENLDSEFSFEEVRNASPERRAWYLRILALAQATGSSVKLARQAVEAADQNQEAS
jgi:hypothetical protein